MTPFEIFGILFLCLGAVQALVSLGFLFTTKGTNRLLCGLFLFLALLMLLAGGWMLWRL